MEIPVHPTDAMIYINSEEAGSMRIRVFIKQGSKNGHWEIFDLPRKHFDALKYALCNNDV